MEKELSNFERLQKRVDTLSCRQRVMATLVCAWLCGGALCFYVYVNSANGSVIETAALAAAAIMAGLLGLSAFILTDVGDELRYARASLKSEQDYQRLKSAAAQQGRPQDGEENESNEE